MKPTTVILALGALCFALLAAPDARAQTGSLLTYSDTLAQKAPGSSETFTLPGFDTTQGTLNQVVFTLTETITTNLTVTNPTSVTQPFTNAYASLPFTVAYPDPTNQGSIGIQGFTDYFSGNAQPGANVYPVTTSSPASISSTVPMLNSYLYESGPISLTASVGTPIYDTLDANPAGLVFGGQNTTATATVAVTYQYTPNAAVPEAGTLPLLTMGLVGLGLAVCRRK